MTPEGVQLNEIDRQFAAFICRQAGSRDRHLESAAALLSRGVVAGDVCLDLACALAEGSLAGQGIESVEAWAARLREFPVVGAPGAFRPLILDGANRLYLQRYWRYEQELATSILTRGATAEFDRKLLKEGLARLFPGEAAAEPDWQRVAALTAVTRNFCVITGGRVSRKT